MSEKSLSQLPQGDEHLKETLISSEQLFQGAFLNLKRDVVSLPDGKRAAREYLTHPGAVAIFPVLDDGRILLERQYRYPVGQAILEIPAGKLEEGEDPLLCAQRELTEETGYTATSWSFLGRIHPVISYSTEFIDIYLAKGLTPGDRSLDEGEFLDVFAATLEELSAWVRNGSITDVKTIISNYWYQEDLAKNSKK